MSDREESKKGEKEGKEMKNKTENVESKKKILEKYLCNEAEEKQKKSK